MTTAKKGSTNGAVVVDADEQSVVIVDLADLFSGEIMDAEIMAEAPISDLFNDDRRKGALIVALGCVVRRRTDPDMTFEQAKKTLRVFLKDQTLVPPTSGRASSTRSRSRSTSA